MPPLLQRILRARGIHSPDRLIPGLAQLPSPSLLEGIDEAVTLLLAHRKGRVLVVGDFDADGATSCALLMRALPWLGFTHIDYLVPNRFEYGYGLTPEIVELALQRRPDLIVTVDNGISSIEGVITAHEHGIPVLITDHHLPGAELPPADAIVNPNRPGCHFPGKSLAGVGVAFYLTLAVRAALRDLGEYEGGAREPRLADLLDLVALGTVADVVPLDDINRTLVHEGLRRIRAGRACAGILALLDVAGRERTALVASDLGFAVAPRLNAAGRLEDMSRGIECLLTDDPDTARRAAAMLDDINRQRREIESRMKEQADEALAQFLSKASGELPAGLCLYDADWHQGVVGILASRIKERFHRPVIVFADEGPDDSGARQLKGSARSVQGFHIRDALESIATAHPGLINRFGGHAMAAGLSLPESRLEDFRRRFADCAARWLGDEAGQHCWVSDGALDGEAMTLETAMLLREATPWGQAFPEPQFDGVFELRSHRIVGEKHLKMQLSVPKSDKVVEAIAFNAALDDWPSGSVPAVQLVFRLDVNRFRGEARLQLLVEALRPVTDIHQT
ncbi:MAG: single-stranded-DNA-specific exonuclease RecJ [Pseudohongiellaceae bacterium]